MFWASGALSTGAQKGPKRSRKRVDIDCFSTSLTLFDPILDFFWAPRPRVGNENSAQSFSDRSFWKSLTVVDVRAFGSWISAPKCLFFSRILSALTEVLGRDIRANDPRMSAGYPARKLPLWADFSFLREGPGTHFSELRLYLQLWARRAQLTPVAGPGNPNGRLSGVYSLSLGPFCVTCEPQIKIYF